MGMGRKHQRRLKQRLDSLESDPFRDPVFADDVEGYRDPPKVNGHVPDYGYETAFGEIVVGEVERCGDNSAHTQSQERAFEQFDSLGPFTDNETVFYGCEEEEQNGLFPDWL